MFDNHYGLTQAVVEHRKTNTRRIITNPDIIQSLIEIEEDGDLTGTDAKIIIDNCATYKIGEIVAVAQCLRDMGYDHKDRSNGHIWGLDHEVAWTNKMFVSAKQCIHHIKITNVRVERLQDISNEDCLREGICHQSFEQEDHDGVTYWDSGYAFDGSRLIYNTPREAFVALIDKVSGKGTWESNPFVFVYEFELVK